MSLDDIFEDGVRPEWFTDETIREARWLLPFTRRISKAFERRYARVGDEPVAGESLEEVVDDTFDEMEKRKLNPGFLGADELTVWLIDLSGALVGEEDGWKTWQEFGEKLPVLLLRPLRQYSFEVDVVPAHKYFVHGYGYTSELRIGGINDLALRSVPTDGRSSGLRVSGSVKAASLVNLDWLARRTERILDEVCGALRALDLAEFVSLPHPATSVEDHGRASLPVMRVKGWTSPIALEPSYARRLFGFVLNVPRDLDELRRKNWARSDFSEALGPRHRVLTRVLQGTSRRCVELRAACCRMVEAELCTDFGLTVTLAFSALEGLLLDPVDKEDVTARLTEAVAHGIAGSAEERSGVRKQVRALYKKRSQFVHTGTARQATLQRRASIELGYRVLRRELELLRDDAGESLGAVR